jgi:hypothetical protein
LTDIRYQPVPEAARRALEESLTPVGLIDPVSNALTLYRDLTEDSKVAMPFYTVAASEYRPSALEELAPTGWAFIVRTRITETFDSALSLAYVAGQEPTFRFTHMTHGWLAASVSHVLHTASSGVLPLDGVFSPALIQVFATRTTALWFRNEASERDKLIPLSHRFLVRSEAALLGSNLQTRSDFLGVIEQHWESKSRTPFNNAPLHPDSVP